MALLLFNALFVSISAIRIQPDTNNANISVTIGPNTTITASNEWYIDLNKQSPTKIPLLFKLDVSSYGFVPNSSYSKLSIVMNGYCGNPHQCDAFFIFGTRKQYFSFVTDYDGGFKISVDAIPFPQGYGLFIYPSPNSPLQSGDFIADMKKTYSSNAPTDIRFKTAAGRAQKWYKLTNVSQEYPGSEMSEFEIVNDDINDKVNFTYYSSKFPHGLSAQFNGAFRTGHNFHVGIIPDVDLHEILIVESMDFYTNNTGAAAEFSPTATAIDYVFDYRAKIDIYLAFNPDQDVSNKEIVSYFTNIVNESLNAYIGNEDECIHPLRPINITLNADDTVNITVIISACDKDSQITLIEDINDDADVLATEIETNANEANSSSPVTVVSGSVLVSAKPIVDDEDDEALMDLNRLYYTILIIIASTFVSIGLFGWIDATKLRRNDFFKFSAILSAMLHVIDLLSDIFFAAKLSERINESVFLHLFIATIFFIVVPIFMSIVQLLHQIHDYWQSDQKTKLWLSKHIKIVYMLSVFTGSSFTAVQLLNTNLFQLDILSMDLSDGQLNKFLVRRVHSLVLTENIPQVIIQFLYLLQTGEFEGNGIAISSMIFSGISILITIMSLRTRKKFLDSQEYAMVTFDVTGASIIRNTAKCRNKTKKIKNRLASVLGLNDKFIEILRPQPIPNGLEMTILIHVDRISVRDRLQELLNDAHQNGELHEIIKNGWNVGGFHCGALSFQLRKSKKSVKNSASTKGYSGQQDDATKQQIEMNALKTAKSMDDEKRPDVVTPDTEASEVEFNGNDDLDEDDEEKPATDVGNVVNKADKMGTSGDE